MGFQFPPRYPGPGTAARRERHFVPVLHVSLAFHDDVSVRLEQADDLVFSRHPFTLDHAALCLIYDFYDRLKSITQ